MNKSKLLEGIKLFMVFIVPSLLMIFGCNQPMKKVGANDTEKTILLREPYLQNSFADSISVLWNTNKAKKSYVKYGKTKDLNLTTIGEVKIDSAIVRSTVTLKGLERGVKYYYAIYSDDKLLASGDDYFFRTESLDKNSRFTFYAMGDIGEPVKTGGFPQVTSYQINNLKEKPNFGIGLGDIIYPDGKSSFADEYLFKPMEPILKNIPFYPALGNHDWHVNPDYNFIKEWKLPNNEHYYSFDYENSHFIALDTRNGGALFDAENQIKWFEKDLKNSQGKYDWIFVYFHHNGITCTYKTDNTSVMGLYPLFSKYNVDLVLNGHAHTYERLHPLNNKGKVIEKFRTNKNSYPEISNGFIQITTGAGGKLKKDWKPANPGNCSKDIVAAVGHTGHFSLISIEGKKLKLKAISSIGGAVLDTLVIDKN